MLKKYICILCPNGCEIEAEIKDTKVISIEGATCPKGRTYVEEELINPQRNISTTVLVDGGILLQTSVRLTDSIPKNRIFDAMKEIQKIKLEAPVEIGQIIIENILELNVDVITTKKIEKL